MNFISIKVSADQQQAANDWVVANIDPAGSNTFMLNPDTNQCEILLQDSGDDYTEKMKEHFGYEDKLPDLQEI